MSDVAATGEKPGAPESNPLGSALGLKPNEVEALGTVFTEAARSLGIDGAPIFERLKQGQSIGQALAMPKGVGDLLYARAHRWFTIGRVEKAEPLFRALCILEESNANYWVGYGVCLRLRNSLNEAAMAFDAGARLRPSWAVPHFHALELAVHQAEWEKAAQCLAMYDERASDELPQPIRTEVERLRTAVALRNSGAKPA